MVSDVLAALLRVRGDDGQALVPGEVWPEGRRDVSYLAAAAEQALAQRRSLVVGLDAAERPQMPTGPVYVTLPLEMEKQVTRTRTLDPTAPPAPLSPVVL